jgi:hypothetical protein
MLVEENLETIQGKRKDNQHWLLTCAETVNEGRLLSSPNHALLTVHTLSSLAPYRPLTKSVVSTGLLDCPASELLFCIWKITNIDSVSATTDTGDGSQVSFSAFPAAQE